MKLAIPLLAVLAVCTPAPAQDYDQFRLASTAPIVAVTYSGPILMAHHADGAVTGILTESILDGSPQLSFYDGERTSGDTDRQGDPADSPFLETCWKDLKGANHCVRTPLASTSKSAIERAMKTHQALVAAMQKIWPPAPPE
jgi:hypothetical protein